jgi:hypothetical protein
MSRLIMPATALAQDYHQGIIFLTVEGEVLPRSGESPTLASIQRAFRCQLEIQKGKTKRIEGDNLLLQDLLTVLSRYLDLYLSNQSQGTFSGSVAIRPLDFLFHRLTVRQGDGIVQVDLAMTDLYDLAEVLANAQADLPELSRIKGVKVRSKRRSGPFPAIAALLVGGIGVAAAITILNRGNDTPDQQTALTPPTENRDASIPAPDLGTSNETKDQQKPAANVGQTALAPEKETQPELPSSAESDLQSDLQEEKGERPKQDPANLPATEEPELLSDIGQKLQTTLSTQWQVPPEVKEDLVYTLVVDPSGDILSVTPEGETADKARPKTPLAQAPAEAPDSLPEGSEAFLVILRINGVIEVQPL